MENRGSLERVVYETFINAVQPLEGSYHLCIIVKLIDSCFVVINFCIKEMNRTIHECKVRTTDMLAPERAKFGCFGNYGGAAFVFRRAH